MNDRIKELLNKSATSDTVAWYIDPEKFAELIVRECCIEIAEEAAKHSHYGMGVLAVSSNSIARIKQHFGIK